MDGFSGLMNGLADAVLCGSAAFVAVRLNDVLRLREEVKQREAAKPRCEICGNRAVGASGEFSDDGCRTIMLCATHMAESMNLRRKHDDSF